MSELEEKPSGGIVTRTVPSPEGKLWAGLTKDEASKGFVRPRRNAVVHLRGDRRCAVTILRPDVAEFHARQPGVIDRLPCSECKGTFSDTEFIWNGTLERVGSKTEPPAPVAPTK